METFVFRPAESCCMRGWYSGSRIEREQHRLGHDVTRHAMRGDPYPKLIQQTGKENCWPLEL